VWNASNFQTIPQFEAKVRDIVGLYLDPPDRALVLCVDEKSQIQALDRTAPILPLRPGLPERQTHGLQARASRVSFEDGAGVTQTVSVAASSLYEAANGWRQPEKGRPKWPDVRGPQRLNGCVRRCENQ
jgi:hypothetical protein